MVKTIFPAGYPHPTFLNPETRLGNPFPRFGNNLGVMLIVGTPIVPGQTIVFRWESEQLGFGPLNLGAASITLQLVDDVGNLDPTGVLHKSLLSTSELDAVVNQREFSSRMIEAPLGDELAKRVYRVGTKKLRLILESGGSLGAIQSADEMLSVQLPTIDDTWWMWDVPATTAEWKKPYIVAGSLTNNAVAPATALVTLLESDPSDQAVGEMSLATDMIGSLIGSQQNVAVTFSGLDLTKKWSWFTTGVWIAYGAAPRVFGYRVRLDITDQYQNGYPPFFTTQNASVLVMVSITKEAACALAFSLQIAAAIMLTIAAITAITSPTPWTEAAAVVEAGIAGGLEAAALISGAVAGDPPTPDRRFHLLRAPSPIRLVQRAEASDLAPFLNAIFNVPAHVEAMGETDSRIAGARAAHDHRWVKTQTDHFNALRGKLPSLARQISSNMHAAADFVAKSMEKLTLDGWDRAIDRLGHDLAFRGQALKVYSESGGVETGFNTLVQCASAAEFGDAIANPSQSLWRLDRLQKSWPQQPKRENPLSP
jgi:hypothetical protein